MLLGRQYHEIALVLCKLTGDLKIPFLGGTSPDDSVLILPPPPSQPLSTQLTVSHDRAHRKERNGEDSEFELKYHHCKTDWLVCRLATCPKCSFDPTASSSFARPKSAFHFLQGPSLLSTCVSFIYAGLSQNRRPKQNMWFPFWFPFPKPNGVPPKQRGQRHLWHAPGRRMTWARTSTCRSPAGSRSSSRLIRRPRCTKARGRRVTWGLIERSCW